MQEQANCKTTAEGAFDGSLPGEEVQAVQILGITSSPRPKVKESTLRFQPEPR